ncbi:rhomboid family intramembrane serine protease [bacterium]|nr:MAG: rhomboid family intramembrane serine protease [bacterium]
MHRLSALFLAAALAGSPAAAQLRAAAVRVPAAAVPPSAVLGAIRASFESGLGLAPGASARVPLPELHLAVLKAQAAALSPQNHAKLALIVRALEAVPTPAPAAASAPSAQTSLAAMEVALSGLSLERLKDPAAARAAASTLWDGLGKRSGAAVPGAEGAGRPGLAAPRPAKGPSQAKPAPPAPERSAARWPLVTAGLLAANALVYLAPSQGWFTTEGWRLSLPALAAAFDAGGWAGLAAHARPFASSMFLHADFGHFLHNALGLAFFGSVVERAFGHLKTAALFLGAGLAAGALWAAAHWGAAMGSMGASGGVVALAGAFLAYYALELSKRPSKDGWQEFWMLPLTLLASVAVFQLVGDVWGVASQWSHALGFPFGELGRTNHLSHLVGLLAGLVAARAWLRRPARPAA